MKAAAAEILLDSSKFFPYLHFMLVYSVASFFGAVPKEKNSIFNCTTAEQSKQILKN